MEARLRQLEGKMLASGSGVARGKAGAPKYDAQRQGAAGAALLSQPKAYNADADVTADAGRAKKDKKKKVGVHAHRPLAVATERAEGCSLLGSCTVIAVQPVQRVCKSVVTVPWLWLSSPACCCKSEQTSVCLCRRRGRPLLRLLELTAAQRRMVPWRSRLPPRRQSRL